MLYTCFASIDFDTVSTLSLIEMITAAVLLASYEGCRVVTGGDRPRVMRVVGWTALPLASLAAALVVYRFLHLG